MALPHFTFDLTFIVLVIRLPTANSVVKYLSVPQTFDRFCFKAFKSNLVYSYPMKLYDFHLIVSVVSFQSRY